MGQTLCLSVTFRHYMQTAQVTSADPNNLKCGSHGLDRSLCLSILCNLRLQSFTEMSDLWATKENNTELWESYIPFQGTSPTFVCRHRQKVLNPG